MHYVSTRGEAPEAGFADILLAGLAPDGGLYLPAVWPQLSGDEIAGFAAMPYWQVASRILGLFAGDDIARSDLESMARDAYATFRHDAVAPLGFAAPPAATRAPHFLGVAMTDGMPEDISADLPGRLRGDNVHVSVRGRSIRLTPHLYNDEEDIARLAESLKRLRG